jgi:hypothetical protein
MKRLIAGSAVVLLLLAGLPSRALAVGSFSATIPVQASVITGCIFVATALDFGPINPITLETTPVTTNGLITLTCVSIPVALQIDLDRGQNGAIAPILNSTRAMFNGTSYLGYDVYQPTTTGTSIATGIEAYACGTLTTYWGVGSAALRITTGLQTTNQIGVCGKVPAQITPLTPGIYVDSLTATATF